MIMDGSEENFDKLLTLIAVYLHRNVTFVTNYEPIVPG
jgi:hypothetical protein